MHNILVFLYAGIVEHDQKHLPQLCILVLDNASSLFVIHLMNELIGSFKQLFVFLNTLLYCHIWNFNSFYSSILLKISISNCRRSRAN